jgi:1-acyl-sn-glycerol-3-phosphate acyltransferase
MKWRGRRRWVITAMQHASWLAGRILCVRFATRTRFAVELFGPGFDRRIILAPTHQSLADPWLLAASLNFRQWRMIAPVRVLATQSFDGLRILKPLICLLYWLAGAAVLPPPLARRDLPTKVEGLLAALEGGDPVVIFPEGAVRSPGELGVGTFASGVAYVHRVSGAPIVPVAIWMDEHRWPRRRCIIRFGAPLRIPEGLDAERGASWLRDRTIDLKAQVRQDAVGVNSA